MKNFINQEACTQCRLCVEICPCHIYGVNEQRKVYIISGREAICQLCGQCMAVCKPEAIIVDGLSYKHDFFPLPENHVDYKSFMDFLATRRSVRKFTGKPVSDEVMNQILDAIAFAPFGAMPEKMHITAINNRAVIEKSLPYVIEFLDNVVRWMKNPIASLLIKIKNPAETYNTLRNHLYPILKSVDYKGGDGDRITRNAPALLIFHAEKGSEEHTDNALIYCTYAMMAAHSLGLGTTMNGIIPPAINKEKELKEFFGIPEDHEAVISLIMGYPKYKYQKAIRRKNCQVHWIA
ncbi:MAG: nitroreductase family protein [Bacteroidales bacterium]|nr:nitroreductase family protein [Bacteroidales bacterium]